MATHSSTLAWKIPWMGESGRLQSMGLQRVRHNMSDFTFFSLFHSIQGTLFLSAKFHLIFLLQFRQLSRN